MRFQLFLFAFSSLLFGQASSQDCPIFPHPTTYIVSGGDVSFENLIAVSSLNLTTRAKDDLKHFIPNELHLNVAFVTENANMVFKRLVNVPLDAYSIKIEDKITVSYSSEASLFYAIQSIKQLVKKNDKVLIVPKCFVSDQPKYQWRGMHLDVSRHFFTVKEVKKYLDFMARYKFNKFHWHLTDDQGWRIEIKKYPKLTEIGSVRDKTLVGHASNPVKTYDLEKHTGFYTQEEVKEIVKYAAERFIEVVPEIEMPGHARAALAAYPQFSCDGKKESVAETWGVFEKVFCSKNETIDFLQDILTEVVAVFPGKYVHIGGDEAPKTNWKACSNCQSQMKAHQLKSEEELQSYFVSEMDKFLQSKGKTLIGWDEILEGGLSENALVMSWRGTKGGIEAAEQNHYVIMTPGSHCYFDHYQSDRSTEPLAIGGFTTLEKVYSFDPIPAELKVNKQGFILGAQANLWTEYISNFSQLEYMILPRMIALSEVLWGNKTDYPSFLARLSTHELPFLESNSVNYSKAAFYLSSKTKATDGGVEVSFFNTNSEKNINVTCSTLNAVQKLDKKSVFVHKTKLPQEIIITAQSETEIGVDEAMVKIWQHSTLGETWSFDQQPSPDYAGTGATTLTDGNLGARPWNGKEWLGFEVKDLTLDLQIKDKIPTNSINISLLSATTSWIYLPESITVRYSKNGKKWKETSVYAIQELNRISIGKKSRYLEVKIDCLDLIPNGQNGAGHLPWLFIDELWLD